MDAIGTLYWREDLIQVYIGNATYGDCLPVLALWLPSAARFERVLDNPRQAAGPHAEVRQAGATVWGRHGLGEACQNWEFAGNPSR